MKFSAESYDENENINNKNNINKEKFISSNLKDIQTRILEGFNNIKKINKNKDTKMVIRKVSPMGTDRSSNNSSKSNIEQENKITNASNIPRKLKPKITNKSHDYKNIQDKNLFNEIFNIKETEDRIPLCINKENNIKFNVFSHNIKQNLKHDLYNKMKVNTEFDVDTKRDKFNNILNTDLEQNEEEFLKECEDIDDSKESDEKIEIIFNNLKNNEIGDKEMEDQDDDDDYCENIIIKNNGSNNNESVTYKY